MFAGGLSLVAAVGLAWRQVWAREAVMAVAAITVYGWILTGYQVAKIIDQYQVDMTWREAFISPWLLIPVMQFVAVILVYRARKQGQLNRSGDVSRVLGKIPRVALGTLLAPMLSSALLAVWVAVSQGNGLGALELIFIGAFLVVTYIGTVIIGLPVHYMLAERRRTSPFWYLGAGLLGGSAMGLWLEFVNPGFSVLGMVSGLVTAAAFWLVVIWRSPAYLMQKAAGADFTGS
ncbi:hypothetical protein [Alkalilimnicola ehrlichii]|uniref:hypothetical protein n=1 Tax=Alkalilimnicola ehrlichii TaxID=351052 RepID=UPI0011C06866|nr:hypothetical protein [Alkalilimnicola ehrlichii]